MGRRHIYIYICIYMSKRPHEVSGLTGPAPALRALRVLLGKLHIWFKSPAILKSNAMKVICYYCFLKGVSMFVIFGIIFDFLIYFDEVASCVEAYTSKQMGRRHILKISLKYVKASFSCRNLSFQNWVDESRVSFCHERVFVMIWHAKSIQECRKPKSSNVSSTSNELQFVISGAPVSLSLGPCGAPKGPIITAAKSQGIHRVWRWGVRRAMTS